MQFYKRIPIYIAALVALINPTQSMAVGPPPPGGTPAPVLTGIILSGPTVVDEQTTVQYTCVGKYSDSTTAPIDAIWEVTTADASISSTGLLSVGAIASDQAAMITVSFGGYSKTLDVIIQSVAPVLTGITISGPATVDEGTSARYTCIGKYSDSTSEPIHALWEVTTTDASINSDGLLSVGAITSDQDVIITASVDGYSETLDVVIKAVAPVLTGITIFGPTTVDEETSAQYACTANYSDGAALSVVPSWTVLSSSAGIDTAGKLSVGSISSDKIISVEASYEGKIARYEVTLVNAPVVLESLTILGAVSMDENTSMQLNCVAQYSDGSAPSVNPSWSVDSPYAQIAQNGWLSAGDVTADVGVTVSASLDGVTGSHNLLIKYVAPVLERIEVMGPSSVAEGESANYTCIAYYDDDSSKAVDPVWSETSSYADVNSSGTLSTYDVPADQSLTLTATYEGKSDSVGVQITYDVPDLLSLLIEGAAIVEEGASTRYSCTASYSDGSSFEVDPVWTVTSDLALISTNGTLSVSEVITDKLVHVSASYGGFNASIEVLLKDIPLPVLLESLSISGVTEVMENSSVALTCQASYSDGSIQTVTPVWSVDSTLASVSADGVFEAGNIESNVVVEVMASFGDLDARHTISVAMISTQIIYPLSGFEGKTVIAEIFDYESGDWSSYGPSDDPEELVLEDLDANKWYWISVSESNTTSGAWNEVQANWFHM